MSDKLPEYIPLGNDPYSLREENPAIYVGENSAHLVFPTQGLYSTYVNSSQHKYQSTCSTVHSMDPPPGFNPFDTSEPRRHASEFTNIFPQSIAYFPKSSAELPKQHTRDFLNFEPLSKIIASPEYCSDKLLSQVSREINSSEKECESIPTPPSAIYNKYQNEKATMKDKIKIHSSKELSSAKEKKPKPGGTHAFDGNLVEKIKDQRASQHLQKAIQKASESIVSMVINKVRE
jgi:hypothetical protein